MAVQPGSRETLARIYEKYLDSMLTLAMGLLNNRAAAEDIVHDVFVSLAQSKGWPAHDEAATTANHDLQCWRWLAQ